MREKFQAQLEDLHEHMIRMGGLCEDAICAALEALTRDTAAPLERVAEADAEIDRLERENENRCMKLLLEQQPVATDLREISAALKMVSDMERIGDQASDIAEIIRQIQGKESPAETMLEAMGKEAAGMVSRSIQAFVNRSNEDARQVILYDDVVDDWFTRIREELTGRLVTHPGEAEYCLDLLLIAKYLERIADHATNIGEWVEFAVTGVRSKNGKLPGEA